MADAFDKGSAVLVEVEFRKQTPFGTADFFDPASPKITITDPGGTDKVVDAALTKDTTGKYHYICQTAVDWQSGKYTGKVTGGDGAYTDVTINKEVFKLR